MEQENVIKMDVSGTTASTVHAVKPADDHPQTLCAKGKTLSIRRNASGEDSFSMEVLTQRDSSGSMKIALIANDEKIQPTGGDGGYLIDEGKG